MKKAIIFGGNGQTGHYLSEICQRNAILPIVVSRSGGGNSERIIKADVSRYSDVETIVADEKPDYIFHLAAKSSVAHTALFENHETISTGSLNILEVTKQIKPDIRIFLAGSALQFVNTGKAIKETDPFSATSAYVVSRNHSVFAARYYRYLGLKVYTGYLFHHESPLRKENHVSQMIASHVKKLAIAMSKNEIFDKKLEIGDTTVKKEWNFAGDIANGIFTLISQDSIFEAVIGNGIPYSIAEWLDCCFGLIGQNWKEHVVQKNNFKKEHSLIYSDPSTLMTLGWKPQISFAELSRMMIKTTEFE